MYGLAREYREGHSHQKGLRNFINLEQYEFITLICHLLLIRSHSSEDTYMVLGTALYIFYEIPPEKDSEHGKSIIYLGNFVAS